MRACEWARTREKSKNRVISLQPASQEPKTYCQRVMTILGSKARTAPGYFFPLSMEVAAKEETKRRNPDSWR